MALAKATATKPRKTVHDKKRQGKHHKSTKRYTKTYWPYLPMFVVLIIGIVVNFSWNAGKAVLGYATQVSPHSLLQETNIQRNRHDRTALVLNNKLAAAAQAKANDMAARDYWSHATPDGKQPWKFIADSGYAYRAAGENLAYGFDSSGATVAGWMNSPGHRENVLNNAYQEVGFGIANVDNYQGRGKQTVIVAMYGQPQNVVTPQSAQNGTAAVAARVTDPSGPSSSGPAAQNAVAAPQTLEAHSVSRLAILTNGQASWAAIGLVLVAGASIAVFFVRHLRLWRRLIVKGEDFIIRHPLIDTAFVAIGVIGFLLTRTTGFIH